MIFSIIGNNIGQSLEWMRNSEHKVFTVRNTDLLATSAAPLAHGQYAIVMWCNSLNIADNSLRIPAAKCAPPSVTKVQFAFKPNLAFHHVNASATVFASAEVV